MMQFTIKQFTIHNYQFTINNVQCLMFNVKFLILMCFHFVQRPCTIRTLPMYDSYIANVLN